MTSRRWSKGRLISLIALLGLAACTPSLQSEAPTRDMYVLRPVVTPVVAERPLRLQVLPVRVRPGYASDAILRSGPDRTLDIFAASRWPDALPRVVEGLLVDGLQSAGVGEVLEPLSSARADWLLQVVVRRFDADYSGGERSPQVRVSWDVLVMDRVRREVAVSFSVESTVPATQNRMSPIIAAFEQASADALSQVAQRLADPAWRQPGTPSPTAP